MYRAKISIGPAEECVGSLPLIIGFESLSLEPPYCLFVRMKWSYLDIKTDMSL
jgi:hypothetical protein